MATYRYYVGIDWATQAHQVCVLDGDGRRLLEKSVANTTEALLEFGCELAALAGAVCADLAVGIEVPHGAVVELLVEREFHVYAINPKQLDRFRDRHTVAGAKDDRRDALVLADSLRTDQKSFRRVQLDEAIIIELRELSRLERMLEHDLGRETNRLREQVHRISPHLLWELCKGADEPWFWDLLSLVTQPQPVLRRAPIAELLKRRRIRRFDADQVLAVVRAKPLPVAPGVLPAVQANIQLLLPVVLALHAQAQRCQQRLTALLGMLAEPAGDDPGQSTEQRDVQIILSLPGVGRIVAATLLAEASQPLAQQDYHTLRAQAGVAPVTRQSGKKKVVVMRYSCNRHLREAFFHWARVSAQHDAHSKAQYAAYRARGHSHGRALRGVADGLLRVLIAMLTARTTYDPTRRGASQTAADPAQGRTA